ncbi:FimD/PapC C-terminal domain-containing protein [Phytobacter massiliensis]|uniref:FimD/PapC C-terminal domain-containing protein n=1 Tax=Phytobacter massiliensis TaxID=1485952 RepID=UPI001F444218|nr:FimD/PapC C-terminal domain-containing protein [Phytobacter massiliensis]
MDGNAELIESEKRVAPLSGSASKVIFRTRSGTALLIKAHFPGGEPLPLGADVLDDDGNVIGMTGQNGQIYVRSEKIKAILLFAGARARMSAAIYLSILPMLNLNSLWSD